MQDTRPQHSLRHGTPRRILERRNLALRRHALKVEQAKQLAAILLDTGATMDEIRSNPRARANESEAAARAPGRRWSRLNGRRDPRTRREPRVQ